MASERALNERCPWSGEPVPEGDAACTVQYRGRTVGFCNAGCAEKFRRAVGAFDPLVESADAAGAVPAPAPAPQQPARPAQRRRSPCVLVTNDDGPHSERHSPFLDEFVALLQAELTRRRREAGGAEPRGGRVLVCVPGEQQSWNGKSMSRWGSVAAHRGWATPEEAEEAGAAGRPLWCVVRGATPATACHLALTQEELRPFEVDLVVAGPNLGRNAGRSCILSSGTVGAALEGCLQGVPSVAVSVAYRRPPSSDAERTSACRLAVRSVLEAWDRWADGVPLYNINVPLGADPERAETRATHVLQDSYGTIFGRVDGDAAAHADDAAAVANVRRSGAPGVTSAAYAFGAAGFGNLARFSDLPDYPGSDICALAEGHVSVTALRGTLAEARGVGASSL